MLRFLFSFRDSKDMLENLQTADKFSGNVDLTITVPFCFQSFFQEIHNQRNCRNSKHKD